MISKLEDIKIYDSKNDFIRSVKHNFNYYLNTNKYNFIYNFIIEYRKVMSLCLDELWNKNYVYEIKNKQYNFHLKYRIFNGGIPKYFNTSKFNCLKNYNGFLSGRMLSNIVNQLAGILRGELNSSRILKHKFERPSLKHIYPIIQPKHIKIVKNINNNSIFKDYFILINLTKIRNENIIIPIKTHKMNDHYNILGERMNSIQLTEKTISYLYKIKGFTDISKTLIIGADMGQNKILTLSNNQITPNKNKQGATFKKLENKIKRKKYNSKSYKKALIEMKIFTRETLNNLNINNAKELRFESNKYIKLNTKNAHKYWQTNIIKNKIKTMCQNNHVDLVLTQPQFKSQRCFKCGYVHKKNRIGEKFVCLMCFHEDDADHNSSSNNTLKLTYDNLWSYRKYSNNSGFFWNINDISVNNTYTDR